MNDNYNLEATTMEMTISTKDIRKAATAAGYGLTMGVAKAMLAIYICGEVSKIALKIMDKKCKIKEKKKETKEEETAEK